MHHVHHLYHVVKEQIAENDKVASIINVYGTQKGDFQDIALTGRQVMFEDFMITRIDEVKNLKKCML